MTTPQDILSFWLDEVDSADWYRQSDGVDQAVRERFGDAYDGAMEGRFGLWLTFPTGVLAYAILLDQFPRNMFRGAPRAFEADPIALSAVKQAIEKGWDLKIDPPARQFFYLPLMHAENLCEQDRCVRLMKDRLPDEGNNLLHAQTHREIIRRFGRFPYRNAALGRTTTAAEQAFMDQGGYGAILNSLQTAPTAAA